MVLKSLTVEVFNKKRSFGEIDTALHNDARTVIEWMRLNSKRRVLAPKAAKKVDSQIPSNLKRTFADMSSCVTLGKPLKLSNERRDAVEDALRPMFSSFDDMLVAFDGWCGSDDFDANEYYSASRSLKYTATNLGAQNNLSHRCLDMLPRNSKLILDVGCGSGLSSQVAVNRFTGAFVVGTDASVGMLELAKHGSGRMDVIRADMQQPMPFRKGCFDNAISVSALHYLVKDGLKHCMQSLVSSVNGKVGIQFYPKDEVYANLLRRVALDAGWGDASLVLDQPHHTQANRWYLFLSPNKCEPSPICRMYHQPNTSCYFRADFCLESIDEAHSQWMKDEHARFARKILRTNRHGDSNLDPVILQLVKELRQAIGVTSTIPPLDEFKNSHFQILDTVLHSRPSV